MFGLTHKKSDNMPVVVTGATADAFGLGPEPKILLLRQDRIGDVLVSAPMIRLLRRGLPRARIDILLSHKNLGARRSIDSYSDNLLVYDKKLLHAIPLIRNIRKSAYDVVVDMLDNASRTSTLFVQYSGSRYALGFDKENSGIYSHVVPLPDKNTVHIVERTARLLTAFGIDPAAEEPDLEYRIDDSEAASAFERTGLKEKPLRLGINLSGSDRAKFWGIKNNLEFILRVNQLFPDIEILVYSTSDYASESLAITGGTKARPAPAAKSFHEFACLLSTCDLIMTPDTSAVHLAAAWKKPCLALFRTDPIGKSGLPWTPYRSPHMALTTDQGTIESISVENALTAFVRLHDLFL